MLQMQHRALVELARRAVGTRPADDKPHPRGEPLGVGMPPIDTMDTHLGLVDSRKEGEQLLVAAADTLLAVRGTPAERLLLEGGVDTGRAFPGEAGAYRRRVDVEHGIEVPLLQIGWEVTVEGRVERVDEGPARFLPAICPGGRGHEYDERDQKGEPRPPEGHGGVCRPRFDLSSTERPARSGAGRLGGAARGRDAG